MILLNETLQLSRCPHCRVADPSLISVCGQLHTINSAGNLSRNWKVYRCNSCGGLITATSLSTSNKVLEFYPKLPIIEESLPEKPKAYLEQAMNSLSSPVGCVLICASCVDAMLKEKGYKKGSLYERIDQAKNGNLITSDMAIWAHEVRLDANDQRHADDNAPLPTQEDAQRVLDFTFALSEYLFVLPSKVKAGRAKTAGTTTP